MAAPMGIPSGDQILAQQGKSKGFSFGPTAGGSYGGGTSPVKTWDTVLPGQFGQLAMWSGDGFLAVTDTQYTPEPPDDGIAYARRGLDGDWEWIPVATGTGVPEAPIDGRTYTRTGIAGGSWQPLPFLLPEAPVTGQSFVRVGLNQTWQPAFSQANADALYAPLDTVSFPEAPTDGIAYARRGWDHTWQPVATGTGIAEAPPTGLNYVRNGLNRIWNLAFTQAMGNSLYAPISTISFPEAPTDGLLYVRNGALHAWEQALTQQTAQTLFAPFWTVSFPEAPTDGRDYARRGADNSWQVIPVVQNWVTDAPADGQLYVRSGTAQSWVNVQLLDLDGGQYP